MNPSANPGPSTSVTATMPMSFARPSLKPCRPAGGNASSLCRNAGEPSPLEPHDLAATKLLVGRDKDIALVRHLGITGRLSRFTVEQRLDAIPKAEAHIITSARALHRAFDETSSV